MTSGKSEGVLSLVDSGVSRRDFARRTMAGGLVAAGSANGRLFQVDGNVLSTVRSAGEVLRVAYGGASNRGGFFPDGVNGDDISAA